MTLTLTLKIYTAFARRVGALLYKNFLPTMMYMLATILFIKLALMAIDPLTIAEAMNNLGPKESDLFKDPMPDERMYSAPQEKSIPLEDMSTPMSAILGLEDSKSPETPPLKWWQHLKLFHPKKAEVPQPSKPHIMSCVEMMANDSAGYPKDGVLRTTPASTGWYPPEIAHIKGTALEWDSKTGAHYQGWLQECSMKPENYKKFMESMYPQGTTFDKAAGMNKPEAAAAAPTEPSHPSKFSQLLNKVMPKPKPKTPWAFDVMAGKLPPTPTNPQVTLLDRAEAIFAQNAQAAAKNTTSVKVVSTEPTPSTSTHPLPTNWCPEDFEEETSVKTPLMAASKSESDSSQSAPACKKNLTGIKNPGFVKKSLPSVPELSELPTPSKPFLTISVTPADPTMPSLSEYQWRELMNTKPDPKLNYAPEPKIMSELIEKLKKTPYPACDADMSKFSARECGELCKLPLSLDHPNYFKATPWKDMALLRGRNILILSPAATASHDPIHEVKILRPATTGCQATVEMKNSEMQAKPLMIDASTQVYCHSAEWSSTMDLTAMQEAQLQNFFSTSRSVHQLWGPDGP